MASFKKKGERENFSAYITTRSRGLLASGIAGSRSTYDVIKILFLSISWLRSALLWVGCILRLAFTLRGPDGCCQRQAGILLPHEGVATFLTVPVKVQGKLIGVVWDLYPSIAESYAKAKRKVHFD